MLGNTKMSKSPKIFIVMLNKKVCRENTVYATKSTVN